MTISLLDIWYFLINFNLLVLFPIFISLLPCIAYWNDPYERDDNILWKLLISIIMFLFFYSICYGVFDAWLNWIDMPYPQIVLDELFSEKYKSK